MVATVLLVEDDFLVRTIAVDALAHAGLDVVEAESGEEALALLRSASDIDVLLTDIGLSGMLDGWALALAARELSPALRVVYVTGADPRDGRAVPGSLFISKPYTPAALVAMCAPST